VKTNSECTLPITGNYEINMTVSLDTGWNLLPVAIPDGAPAADLLSPVNGFVIAKDVAGTGVYWPESGINILDYLLPGKAYFVLLTENGVVDYSGMKNSKNLSGSDKTLSVRTGLIPTFDPLLPNADGHFTENGLSAITDFKEATGIFESSFSKTVNIYPNPTTGKVNISGLIAGAEISIRDLHGQTVANFKDQSEQVDYDLSTLPPGVYLVKIEANGQSIFRKLVVQ
jgi:hypothetical protein